MAQVLVGKYGMHLPLNRQSAPFAREGIPLEVSTLADHPRLRLAELLPWNWRLARPTAQAA